jgi:two-component system response regulator DesR
MQDANPDDVWAIKGGVAGFVLKDAPIEKLAEAIRRCAAGENVVDPELAA